MRNIHIDEVDLTERDVVAIGNDYAQNFVLTQHQHRRAQLLYGATGVMHVSTTVDSGLCRRSMRYGSRREPRMQ